MTTKEANTALREVLGKILGAYGFKRKRDLDFIRAQADRVEMIDFILRKDWAGRIRYLFSVGVRFPAVEALRPEEANGTATFGLPMHFLRTPRNYFEWTLSDPINAAEVSDDVRPELELRALPFFERYASLEALRASLEQDDPGEWVCIGSEDRDELLVLLDFVQDGKSKAQQRLDAALERRAGSAEKTYYRLVKLRDRLAKLGPEADQ